MVVVSAVQVMVAAMLASSARDLVWVCAAPPDVAISRLWYIMHDITCGKQ